MARGSGGRVSEAAARYPLVLIVGAGVVFALAAIYLVWLATPGAGPQGRPGAPA